MMREFISLPIALLTVSDTRSEDDDKSGKLLHSWIEEAGHRVLQKRIVPDNVYQIRAILSQWIADETIQVIITTGGTGFTGRDSTPEALTPLLDKEMDGFGELFRWLSLEEIGASTIQSRALGGIANATLIFALPGSSHACQTGWTKIIQPQLDHRTQPCNFATLAKRFRE